MVIDDESDNLSDIITMASHAYMYFLNCEPIVVSFVRRGASKGTSSAFPCASENKSSTD